MTNIEKFQDGNVGLFTGDDVLNAKKFSKEDNPLLLLSKEGVKISVGKKFHEFSAPTPG